MEIELLEKKDQELLSRVDISFRIKHPNESTPKREEVRDELASQMNVKKGRIIIDHMEADFGKAETSGFAKIYKTEEDAKKIDRDHILVRNKLKAKSKTPPKEPAEKPEKKEVKEELKEEVKEPEPEPEKEKKDETPDEKSE
jgi:ribosomal protein S24E